MATFPAGLLPHERTAPVRVSAAYPLHTILSAFPIACFTGALFTDWAYAVTVEMQWANFSAWLIVVGLIMGALAGVAGIVDFATNRAVRRPRVGWLHGLGNLVAMLLAVVNAFVHSRDAYTSVVPEGLALSALTAILVLITSWLGTRQTMQAHWVELAR